jgi:hypothetical protein
VFLWVAVGVGVGGCVVDWLGLFVHKDNFKDVVKCLYGFCVGF